MEWVLTERHVCCIRRTAGAVVPALRNVKVDAIALYLGADMGGMGSKMSVASREQYLDWKIEKRDGTVETIVIDRKQSNQY